ncbi:MAG: hypothetical protein M1269_09980 [Chloroflexi bacterium]|nr:hypothetical protein [Chloroflexota bacterium]
MDISKRRAIKHRKDYKEPVFYVVKVDYSEPTSGVSVGTGAGAGVGVGIGVGVAVVGAGVVVGVGVVFS